MEGSSTLRRLTRNILKSSRARWGRRTRNGLKPKIVGSSSAAETRLEQRLHELLLFQQRRQVEVKKQATAERQRHKRRAQAPSVPNDCKVEPLPQEVVSDECIPVHGSRGVYSSLAPPAD